jgi:phage-related protein (TIGR01555 family)
MVATLTKNAERQRRYIARLKAKAAVTNGVSNGAEATAGTAPKSSSAPDANPKPTLKFTDSFLARIKQKKHQLWLNPLTPNSQFIPPMPKQAKLAMDSAFSEFDPVSTWAGNTLPFTTPEVTVFPGYVYLAALANRAEYRRIAEIIAQEMTRKWIRLTSTSTDDDKTERIKQLDDELKRLDVQHHFRMLAYQDAVFGRSHLYLDVGTDPDDRDELRTSIGNGRDRTSAIKVGKGKLERLKTIEAFWVYPQHYEATNPLRHNFYEPTDWFVQGIGVHSSRLLKFVSRPVADIWKPSFFFGGTGVLLLAEPYVQNRLRTRQSVSDLVHAFSVWGLETDLSTSLSEGGEETLRRAEAFASLKDNSGIFMVNRDTERFFNVVVPLAGLEGLQAQSQEQMSAVSGVPLIKLLGITPTGLNATAEPEMRSFYESIHSFQELLFRPNLHKLLGFCMLSLWGEIDNDISFEFEPLHQLSELEAAQVRKMEAEIATLNVEAGITSQQEERARLASDPDTEYNALDVEQVPDLLTEELHGLTPPGSPALLVEQEQQEATDGDDSDTGEENPLLKRSKSR